MPFEQYAHFAYDRKGYRADRPSAERCEYVDRKRGGTATTFDVLNKYFGITQMITVGSTYWNQVHGRNAEDAAKDLEGMQTMRNLGHNMAWVLKCLEAGKEKGLVPPTADRSNQTNFIR